MVSIIIPNYNHADFLQERLDSVFNQTITNYEVIILDDASTDGSAEIINQYRNHPKVSQIIINTENSGSPFKQWKRGVEIARGEYIWIAESDDFADKDFLLNLVPFLENNSRVGIAYCQSIMVDEKGKSLRSNKSWTDDLSTEKWDKVYINNGIDECRKFLIFKNTLPNASGIIFRKEAITFKKIVFDMKMTGDWLIWCSILRHWNIAFTPLHLNYFRNHKNSTRVHNTFKKKTRRLYEGTVVFQYITKYFNPVKQDVNSITAEKKRFLLSLLKQYKRINLDLLKTIAYMVK